MIPSEIASYQPGGTAYANAVIMYGQAAANTLASAAATGDQTQLTNAIESIRGNGAAPLNTSTLSIFGNQLATDPLAAPLASANNALGNTFFSFLKNPWVLVAVGVIVFGAMGGFGWIGRKVFK